MRGTSRTGQVALAVVAVLAILLAWLQGATAAGGRPRSPKSAAELAAAVLRSLNEYRATLAQALPIEEAAANEALASFQERRHLHAAGALAVEYVEDARRRWETAQRDLQETKTALEEADQLILEASIQSSVAKLPPLRPGGYEETPGLVRFNGTAPWSLSDVPKLAQAFEQSLGRRLPISALGQTPLHTRLGFDHQKAIDVAVHPDSPDGQWLMKHLRDAGIPFIAIRGAIAGAATGAHIHVGLASVRTVAR